MAVASVAAIFWDARSDPVERVFVVMEDDAAAKAPDPGFLHSLAFVAAGREPAALAIPADQDEEVGGRLRPIAVGLDIGGDVGDHVAKLRSARALCGEALGKGTDRRMAGD